MKLLSTITAIAFCLVLFSSCNLFQNSSTDEKVTNTEQDTTVQPTKEKNDEPIHIAAGGDVMLGSPYPNASRMPPNDGANLLDEVAPLFKAADIAFFNLEGPIVDGGNSGKCGASAGKTCFAFRMPTHYAKYIKAAGLDVVSLANNHAADFGDRGRDSTRNALDALGIKHAGSDKEKYAMTILEVKGKKVAVVAFAHNSLTPNINDLDFAKKLVEEADKKADIVMVTFHGGAEGAANANVPQRTEVFLGEQRGNLPAFARTVIDAGADVVIGHGPHVLRGMEIYKDRLIAYSLGNFVTYGWFPLVGATAETLVLDVNLAADGTFISGKINPFLLKDRGILKPDKGNSSISRIKSLSQTDFPNTMPKISVEGNITP